jgi:Sec7-like guanine-nucleotide exchange factor
MTEKQFIDNILYTTGGEDLPPEFLADLYFRVCVDEIKFTREEVRFPNAIKNGWLSLKTKNLVMSGFSWKKRWVILSDNCLIILTKPNV